MDTVGTKMNGTDTDGTWLRHPDKIDLINTRKVKFDFNDNILYIKLGQAASMSC